MKNLEPSLRASRASALIAAIGLSTAALGVLSVDPATNVIVGTNPSGLAAGDFDGDGDTDLVTTVDDANDIVVLLNDGSGQYALGPNSDLPASSSPQDVVAGRLDGDMVIDLAVAVRDPVGSVIILLGDGAAAFTMDASIAVGERPRGLSIADLEGDGDLDLAVANRDSGSATVLTNDGVGGFTTQTLAIGGEARSTALGDFDGDGDKDLAVTNHDDRSVEIFENVAGTFMFATTLLVDPTVRPDGVAAANLDGDNDDDLAVATSDVTAGINQAAVFLGSPAGFSGPVAYDTGGSNTSEIAAADLDCDGLPDLVTSNADSNDLSLLANVGAGGFGPPLIRAAGTTPGRLALDDFDADGDPDIAVSNRDSDDVSVLINQSCVEPCPGDIDGDGMVDVDDFLALLAAWGPNPGHPADIDGDGTVDVDDFLLLLANWGACP